VNKAKLYAITVSALAMSLAGVVATATTTDGGIITLPAGFLTAALAYIDRLFTDLYPVIAVAIGLPLGFWVIRKAVSLVRAR